MAYGDVTSIRLLKNLFKDCQLNEGSQSDSENEGDFPVLHSAMGPGNIKQTKGGSEVKSTLENSLLNKIDAEPSINSMEEWEQQQIKAEDLLDIRMQPEYSITYKQAVTTEDIYLQMGFKTPATSSCEDMIVDIKLSEETVNIDKMDLKVEPESLKLQTPAYHLYLLLPHKIHPNKGRAEFNTDTKVLKLTLRLNRAYDFINF